LVNFPPKTTTYINLSWVLWTIIFEI
jgi:hypothetical protein